MAYILLKNKEFGETSIRNAFPNLRTGLQLVCVFEIALLRFSESDIFGKYLEIEVERRKNESGKTSIKIDGITVNSSVYNEFFKSVKIKPSVMHRLEILETLMYTDSLCMLRSTTML